MGCGTLLSGLVLADCRGGRSGRRVAAWRCEHLCGCAEGTVQELGSRGHSVATLCGPHRVDRTRGPDRVDHTV